MLRGKDIKYIRKKFSLSQKSFAELLDINVRTLHNYEIDKRQPPSFACSLIIFAGENIELFKKSIINILSGPYLMLNTLTRVLFNQTK